jgi:hypothetical protein
MYKMPYSLACCFLQVHLGVLCKISAVRVLFGSTKPQVPWCHVLTFGGLQDGMDIRLIAFSKGHKEIVALIEACWLRNKHGEVPMLHLSQMGGLIGFQTLLEQWAPTVQWTVSTPGAGAALASAPWQNHLLQQKNMKLRPSIQFCSRHLANPPAPAAAEDKEC